MRKHLLIALSTAALMSTTAFAQTPPTNLEKLGAFKTTGATPNIPTIPQTAIVHHGRLDPGVLLLAKPYRKIDLARMIRKALDVGATPAEVDRVA